MRERLVCDKLRLRGDLQRAFGTSSAGGELDWNSRLITGSRCGNWPTILSIG